jgi:hypothetical protein
VWEGSNWASGEGRGPEQQRGGRLADPEKQHLRPPTSAKGGGFSAIFQQRGTRCVLSRRRLLGELGIPSSLPLDTHRMQSRLGVPRITLRPACIGAVVPLAAHSRRRVTCACARQCVLSASYVSRVPSRRIEAAITGRGCVGTWAAHCVLLGALFNILHDNQCDEKEETAGDWM